jgi:hypothetical protein
MKASVQYGDFKGTSAADISDHEDLEAAARRFGIDTSRYEPLGVRFYSGYKDFFSGSILALDRSQSTESEPYIVEIILDVSRDEFFDMFKRFDVVLLRRFTDYSESEVKDTIHLEDR